MKQLIKTAILLLVLATGVILVVSCSGKTTSSPAQATPTPSFTPSNTPCGWPGNTCTPTPTWTPCFTLPPTSTPGPSTYNLSGAVTCTASVTVDSSHPIGLALGNTSTLSLFYTSVTTNGGTYQFNALPSGSYALAYWFNLVGDGEVYPHVGDFAHVLGGTPCYLATGTSVALNTTQNLTFDNSNQLYGIAGTVTYTGNKGTVDPCHVLVVNLFSNSGYSSVIGTGVVQVNGSRFDALPVVNVLGNLCGSQSVYVQAFYQAPGTSCCTLQTGDPYIQTGPISTSATASNNLMITDSFIK